MERLGQRPVMRTLHTAGVLAGLCAAAVCSPAPSASPAASLHAKGQAAAATARAAASIPVPAGPPRVTVSRVRTADGSILTVAVFGGSVRYVLPNGGQDPGPAYAALVRAGPA